MTDDEFRDGIFALNTRRFGTVAELMVQRMERLGHSNTLSHDLHDDRTQRRVEVKFSRVLRKSTQKITPETVLECIRTATSEHRLVPFTSWQDHRFDSNIQQVKKAEFDVLYYGLFFSDCVKIFRILSDDIGPTVGFSDRQHRGNVGEGQFHITDQNLQTHLDSYLESSLTYRELLDLLSPPAPRGPAREPVFY